ATVPPLHLVTASDSDSNLVLRRPRCFPLIRPPGISCDDREGPAEAERHTSRRGGIIEWVDAWRSPACRGIGMPARGGGPVRRRTQARRVADGGAWPSR